MRIYLCRQLFIPLILPMSSCFPVFDVRVTRTLKCSKLCSVIRSDALNETFGSYTVRCSQFPFRSHWKNGWKLQLSFFLSWGTNKEKESEQKYTQTCFNKSVPFRVFNGTDKFAWTCGDDRGIDPLQLLAQVQTLKAKKVVQLKDFFQRTWIYWIMHIHTYGNTNL